MHQPTRHNQKEETIEVHLLTLHGSFFNDFFLSKQHRTFYNTKPNIHSFCIVFLSHSRQGHKQGTKGNGPLGRRRRPLRLFNRECFYREIVVGERPQAPSNDEKFLRKALHVFTRRHPTSKSPSEKSLQCRPYRRTPWVKQRPPDLDPDVLAIF